MLVPLPKAELTLTDIAAVVGDAEHVSTSPDFAYDPGNAAQSPWSRAKADGPYDLTRDYLIAGVDADITDNINNKTKRAKGWLAILRLAIDSIRRA